MSIPLDEESGAERSFVLWEMLLNGDESIKLWIHEPESGHPKIIHETLGGAALPTFRKAFVENLKKSGSPVFRLTANAFAVLNPGPEEGSYEFVFNACRVRIRCRQFSCSPQGKSSLK